MNREQAVKYLSFSGFSDEQIRTIERAFTCEDAISRQAVLDLINADWKYEGLEEPINSLPPVTPQPKTRWIPVSERLPEDAYGCIVTVLDVDLRTQNEFENILPYFVGYDGGTWNNAGGEPIPYEVIAWMKAPEPYKAEGSGE